MNWKLIVLLSIIGAVMAVLTVFVIPANIEPIFWIAIFVFNAFVITGRTSGKYLGHAWWVSVVSGLWIGIIHAFFHDQYATNHPEQMQQFASMPGGGSAIAMAVLGPLFGAAFGIVSGLISLLVGKLRKKPVQEATA